MNNPETVTEIAVRQVKPGQLATFKKRRAAFIRTLKQQTGIVADREFESFYALPQPDTSEVFIGMTTYASLAAQAKIQRNLGVVFRFLPFMMTMSLKAYVYVQPIEGPAFDLNTLAAGPGQVLEVAVRHVAEAQRAAFDIRRRQFVNLLSSQDGALESYEFKVVKGNNIEGLTVGMTVYESQEAFQRVSGGLMEDPVTQAYFATFTPVAVQYAVSARND